MSTPDDAPTPSLPAVVVNDGARGHAVSYAAERIELVLDRAYPPGCPLSFTLTLGESALRLEGKAIGSKRLDDGRFDVRLKLTSLRREDRSALERAFE